jgi:hypothetical protein
MAGAMHPEFTAGTVTFVVRHELWDENIQDHADQGVAILVKAKVTGKDTTLLRFNCFDIEQSYDYGPENTELAVAGPEMLGDALLTNHYQMDPIACGNPIGWSVRTLGSKLPKMVERAGYPAVAATVDMASVRDVLPDVEACARELFATQRNTVKHNRGTHIFEAGPIRFGLEMRRLPVGDGGLAIHILADIGACRVRSTPRRLSSLPSTISGTARITTTGRATRITAFTGTARSSRTRSSGLSASSRAANCRR